MKLFMLFAGAVACAAQPTMIDYNTQIKNRPIVLSSGAWNFTSPVTVASNGSLPTLTLTQSGSGNALTVNGTGLFNSAITGPLFSPRKLMLLDNSPGSVSTLGWAIESWDTPVSNFWRLLDPAGATRFTWSLVQTGLFYNHAIFEPTATVDIGTLAVAAGAGATVRCASCAVALSATAATGANTAIKGTASGGGSVGMFGLNDSGYGGWFESNTGTALYVNGRSTLNGNSTFTGNAHISGSLTASGTSIFASTSTFNGPVVLNGGCTGCSGGVSTVLASAPVVSSGGANPTISCPTCITTAGGQTISGNTAFGTIAPTTANIAALNVSGISNMQTVNVNNVQATTAAGPFGSAVGATNTGSGAAVSAVTFGAGQAVSATASGAGNAIEASAASGFGLRVISGGATVASTYGAPALTVSANYAYAANFSDAGGTCRIGFASGGITCPSDRRLKTGFKPMAPALAAVMKLKPTAYDWIKSGQHADGLIAQDVQKVFPLAVHEDENGYLNLSYQQLVPYLIKAIQEQQAEIAELKKKLK